MFYDNLKKICEEKKEKITPLVKECGGSTGSISKWRNGAYPNSDIVIKIAIHLGVSTDYLLLGKDSSPELNDEEQECLEVFNRLKPKDRNCFIAKMEQRYEDYSSEFSEELTSEVKENVS